MSEKQKTIAQPVSFRGKGLHTGLIVNLTVHPAEANHGIKFQRTDTENAIIIDALAENVVDTSRGTTIASIANKDVRVSTIEHLMAALYGCDIDNALVTVDAPEVPILDGSAYEYVKAFTEAGLTEQNADREYYEISEKITYEVPEKGVSITIYPDDAFSANVNIDFDSRVVGRQYAMVNTREDIVNNIAPCRTFVFLHELQPLIDHNLIKGGDLDNAIVIVEKTLPQEEIEKLARIFNKENLKVDKRGYLNNIELRFENEIARHKMLDLIGDLALVGKRIKGKVFATRPGHSSNTEMAKLIRKQMRVNAARPKFRYDPNAEPVYDINAVKKLLPHRPPFLLVDKVMHIDPTHVVGIKNVSMNEPFFVGHFPNEPVMPGVLQVEAMAQCGGILALSSVPDPENYSTYFLKIDGVKFKKKVVPGDTLMFVLELLEPIRRGIVIMKGTAYVGDVEVSEATLMARIAKN